MRRNPADLGKAHPVGAHVLSTFERNRGRILVPALLEAREADVSLASAHATIELAERIIEVPDLVDERGGVHVLEKGVPRRVGVLALEVGEHAAHVEARRHLYLRVDLALLVGRNAHREEMVVYEPAAAEHAPEVRLLLGRRV